MAAFVYDTDKKQLYMNLTRVFSDLEKLELPQKSLDAYKQTIQSTLSAEPNKIQKFSSAAVSKKPKMNIKRKSTVKSELAAVAKKRKSSSQLRKSSASDLGLFKENLDKDDDKFRDQFSSTYLKKREDEMTHAVKELANS